jgi:5-methylcytosine-specific restriction endonuclease McrA
MSREVIPATPEAFAESLHELRLTRRRRKAELRGTIAPRQSLSPAERKAVFRKTAGRCHICGGAIDGKKWHADHVFSHSAGGLTLPTTTCQHTHFATTTGGTTLPMNSRPF